MPDAEKRRRGRSCRRRDFSSADVLRSAFQVIKPAPGIKSVSSCFVIVPPEGNTVTDAPAMIFSDCAVIPEPDENQLADVAVAAADSARSIVGIEPKVAMLSFSTKGSAKHERIDKVVHALNIVKESHPELDIDGEMQLDAAIVPVVAKQKAPGSTVAGHANVLVFPNLESGNIGYKIAQRFGGCMAIGPVMQGLANPSTTFRADALRKTSSRLRQSPLFNPNKVAI